MKFSELQRLQRREGITVLSSDARIEQLEARLCTITKERDALQAKVVAMEKQEPVGKFTQHPSHGMWEQDGYSDNPDAKPLYLAPGAQPAPSVPEGWKLVPIEPTHEMLDAGEDTFVPTYTGTPVSAPIDVYRAMLAAAPEAKP